MRILVNYDKAEKGYLQQLAYYLKKHGLTAMVTGADMTITDIKEKARMANAVAVLICNEQTLKNCVPGKEPTLDMYRGSRINFSIPAIVTNKLAHINTVPYGPWLLEQDLAKFKEIHKPAQSFTMTVLTSTTMFEAAYRIMSQALALTYDIETKTYETPDKEIDFEHDIPPAGETVITCAGWTAIMPDLSLRTFVLPLVDYEGDHWKTDYEYELAIRFLRRVNNLPSAKCMHNGLYDAVHSVAYHAEPQNWTLDTMGLAWSEYSELPKTLDFVASYQLYDFYQWKPEAEAASKARDQQAYWTYNGKDTWYTARILLKQLETMPEYARKNYAEQFKLVYPALYMAYEGVLIDNERRKELREEAKEKLEKALARLRVMFADPNFNPGSWQQVQHYFYDVVGAQKVKVGKSKSGTDEKNLSAISTQHPLIARLAKEILDYRAAQKAIGTYYDFRQKNERLLYSIDPFGTETGRSAARSSSFWCGTQIQNIPSYAKAMLRADDGYTLIEFDNNKSEARCTAYLSEDLNLIAALEDVLDFYKKLGTLFFEIPYEKVTKDFRNYTLKKIVHGTNYMMGPKTFIENAGVSNLYQAASFLGITITPKPRANHPKEMSMMAFAKMLLEKYHEPFNKVRPWYQKLKLEIATTGKLVSPLGHTRRFFGDINRDHNILRSAVAHQPQNLSVVVINRGLFKVYKNLVLPSAGAIRLKAQIHDSIFLQIRKEYIEEAKPMVLECMDNPVTVHGRLLRIPVESKQGKYWKEAE